MRPNPRRAVTVGTIRCQRINGDAEPDEAAVVAVSQLLGQGRPHPIELVIYHPMHSIAVRITPRSATALADMLVRAVASQPSITMETSTSEGNHHA